MLIFGTCYAPTQAFANLMYGVWYGCLAQCDEIERNRLVVVDSNSPVDWNEVFPCPIEYVRSDSNDLFDVPDPGPGRLLVVSFRDNIGHVFHSSHVPSPQGIESKDGAGRAFWQGIHLARSWNLQYCAHVECDMFVFGRHLITERARALTHAFTAPRWYDGVETGLVVADTARMAALQSEYDWRRIPVGAELEMEFKHRFEGCYELWKLPGGRDREGAPPPEVMRTAGSPWFWTTNRSTAAARTIALRWADEMATGVDDPERASIDA